MANLVSPTALKCPLLGYCDLYIAGTDFSPVVQVIVKYARNISRRRE